MGLSLSRVHHATFCRAVASSFCSAPAEPILSFSNRRHERKHFLADLLSCLGDPFFVRPRRRLSSAPTVDFRRRRARKLSTAGRRSATSAHSAVSRPRLDSFEHDGRLDDHGPEERSVVECGLLWLSLAWIDVAARSTVLYAVQIAGRTMALRVSTSLCPERAQQEIGAERISRSSRPVPAGTAFRRDMRRKDNSIDLRRLEMLLQRSIGTSCLWSTCDAG